MGQPQQVRLALQLPPEQEVGVYANFASIWQDSDGFILDFATYTHPPQMQEDPDTGQPAAVMAAKVVSRVRIPPGQAWEFAKGLTTQLEQWEQEHGRMGPAAPEQS